MIQIWSKLQSHKKYVPLENIIVLIAIFMGLVDQGNINMKCDYIIAIYYGDD